jgi:hypothetical protein
MSDIKCTTSTLNRADKWDHFKARVGVKRTWHRVEPGLYCLGRPNHESPVFVSANYTLSFDALRSSLKGLDGYILVLDTHGINVWCAAGKGTFGTDELVKRIEVTGLKDVVNHRTLVLPQLGAPGVSAHEVLKGSGFKVEYGPVRAADLPEYLKTHTATPEMRRVRFPLKDRAVLVPVEMVNALLPVAIIALLLFLIGGLWPALMVLTVYITGTVLFPLFLPWIPTKQFSSKGLLLGAAVGLLFALSPFLASATLPSSSDLGYIIAEVLLMAPWVSYLALNFTGCSTYTSRTGVKREIFTFIPVMAMTFIAGVLSYVTLMAGSMMGWF